MCRMVDTFSIQLSGMRQKVCTVEEVKQINSNRHNQPSITECTTVSDGSTKQLGDKKEAAPRVTQLTAIVLLSHATNQ